MREGRKVVNWEEEEAFRKRVGKLRAAGYFWGHSDVGKSGRLLGRRTISLGGKRGEGAGHGRGKKKEKEPGREKRGGL